MNENGNTNEIDKKESDSLSYILMMKSHKTLDEIMSEYTYHDENGARLSSLLYDLNSLEVELHDVITKNVFRGIDYYKLVGIAPTWVRDAGHSQESSMTKARFESLSITIILLLINFFIITIVRCLCLHFKTGRRQLCI